MKKHNVLIGNTTVIEPPNTDGCDWSTRTTRIAIDSKDRDLDTFPNPNKYTIELEDDVDDVVSMQLINFDIPFSCNTIGEPFKYIPLENGSLVQISVQGIYDNGEDLAQMLQDSFRQHVGHSDFVVSYDNKTGKLRFNSATSFGFAFNRLPVASNPAPLLGFARNAVISGASNVIANRYVIESQYRVNPEFNNLMVMHVDAHDAIKSPTPAFSQSFAILHPSMSKNYAVTSLDISKQHRPIIGRIAKLTILFLDRYGNPYDFDNRDHYLDFLFVSMSTKGKYARYYSA